MMDIYKKRAQKLLKEKGLSLEDFDFEKTSSVKASTRLIEGLGVKIEERKVGGSYLQVDNNVIRLAVAKELQRKGVILMDLSDALKNPAFRKFYWQALPVDHDEYTAAAELYGRHGVFLYVPKGVKVEFPLQACFLISSSGVGQAVHNVIVVDDYADLTINTACAALRGEVIHIGVTEMYIGKKASLTYIMVHGWSSESQVRPRTGVVVNEGGNLVSYYVNMKPVRFIEATPRIILKRNAKAYYSSVIVGRDASFMDLGVDIILEEEGASGEIVSRSIARDESRIVMRGYLRGHSEGVRGHLECKGLQLSNKALIRAIPVLESKKPGAVLTHEAAIGRISDEELYYLMTKGFDEEEAISIIVRGFIDVGLEKLPKALRVQLESIYDLVARMATG